MNNKVCISTSDELWFVSEHANETDTICSGTRLSLLTETHTGTPGTLHPNNANRDNGIEIPEEWMPTIKQHNS